MKLDFYEFQLKRLQFNIEMENAGIFILRLQFSSGPSATFKIERYMCSYQFSRTVAFRNGINLPRKHSEQILLFMFSSFFYYYSHTEQKTTESTGHNMTECASHISGSDIVKGTLQLTA